MGRKEIVRQFLTSKRDAIEVQVEYKDGSTTDYSLEEEDGSFPSREAAISHLLSDVSWEQVEEVEIELEDGEKLEIDFDD